MNTNLHYILTQILALLRGNKQATLKDYPSKPADGFEEYLKRIKTNSRLIR